MGLFNKKADPVSERTRALNAEIAALEAQIKKLDNQLDRADERPRMRSTVLPNAAAAARTIDLSKTPEPVFVEVDQNRLKNSAEPLTTPQHFNELGVRKYDMVALIERIKKHFQGPPLANPKLVSYLAAGSVQGLRPLRYEKRVARNRFLIVTIFLAIVLLGLFSFFFGHR